MSAESERLRKQLERPSSARIYDYLLDHSSPNNYAIDREFANRQIKILPDMQKAVRENRRFIGRAVQAAVESGIRQFVDIGSGLPSSGQAHEVADAIAPNTRSRVVYVDNELIANVHSQVLLDQYADPDRHRAVIADYFNHGDLWRKVLSTGLIKPEQPVCLIVTALLHFMPASDLPGVPMGIYRDNLAPGSMLVLTHANNDPEHKGLQAVAEAYSETTSPAYLRTDSDIMPFFGGWPLLHPGLTWAGLWQARSNRSAEPWWDEDNLGGEPWWGEQPSRMLFRAGVGVKPL